MSDNGRIRRAVQRHRLREAVVIAAKGYHEAMYTATAEDDRIAEAIDVLLDSVDELNDFERGKAK